MIRAIARRALQRRLLRRTSSLSAADLARSAVVFSPHPDDETLGCGGLIASKRALGADVTVVYLTDGAASHAHAEGHRAFVDRRRAEARLACLTLGVAADHVVFADVADGQLEAMPDAAVRVVVDVLRSCDATQLVLPHHDEQPSDHRVVRSIVERALTELQRDAQLLLYPVWLWDQWPWTNPLAPPRGRHPRRQILRVAVRDRLGSRLPSLLTHRLDISEVLERKRRALAAHESQTTRLDGNPAWATLADVARGEWLDHLLQPHEYYAMSNSAPRTVSSPSPRESA